MSERLQGLLQPVGRPRGGVPAEHRKNTAATPIRSIATPPEVVLPMAQHIGAPCKPTVKKGDVVAIGDVVGDTDAPLSAPIHASISGTVTDVREITTSANIRCQAVVIQSDGKDRYSEAIKPPKVHDKESFIAAARVSGLVGLGGAGFPTHFKLNVRADSDLDTLIINGAECEPYVTIDHRMMLEKTDSIFPALDLIVDYLNIKNVVIGIEDNKPDAMEKIRAAAESHRGPAKLEVMSLPAHYPQGAEKIIVQSATGRLIPPGKLPLDVGCIVMNITSLIFLSEYLETGRPLTYRSMTIDGGAIREPQNVRVPLGTPISFIVEQVGGFKEDPYRVLMGGPMMGIALDDLETPIIKNNNALTFLVEDDIILKPERNCIRCNRCHVVCPLNLMPMKYLVGAQHQDLEMLGPEGYDVMVCMECGCCSYECPSGIPLLQHIRYGKALLKKGADQ